MGVKKWKERERGRHGERRARKKKWLVENNTVEHSIQLSITINISGLNF